MSEGYNAGAARALMATRKVKTTRPAPQAVKAAPQTFEPAPKPAAPKYQPAQQPPRRETTARHDTRRAKTAPARPSGRPQAYTGPRAEYSPYEDKDRETAAPARKGVSRVKIAAAFALAVGLGVSATYLKSDNTAPQTDVQAGMTNVKAKMTAVVADPVVITDPAVESRETIIPREADATIVREPIKSGMTYVRIVKIKAATPVVDTAAEEARLAGLREKAELARLAALKAEEDRQAALVTEAKLKTELETAPLCELPEGGGNVEYAAFRSKRVMDQLKVKLDTRLVLAPSGVVHDGQPVKCAVTLRSIFSSYKYQRAPEFPEAPEYQITAEMAKARTARLFNQWTQCFATYGFGTVKIPKIGGLNDGLVWRVTEMATFETARGEAEGTVSPCVTSWGRNLAKAPAIATLIAKKRPMPAAYACESKSCAKNEDHGPAVSLGQFMFSGQVIHKIDNPFNIEEAALGARRYLLSIQSELAAQGYTGANLRTAMQIRYNGGDRQLNAARACSGSTKLKASCVPDSQTRDYAFHGTRTKGDPEIVTASISCNFFTQALGICKDEAAPAARTRRAPTKRAPEVMMGYTGN